MLLRLRIISGSLSSCNRPVSINIRVCEYKSSLRILDFFSSPLTSMLLDELSRPTILRFPSFSWSWSRTAPPRPPESIKMRLKCHESSRTLVSPIVSVVLTLALVRYLTAFSLALCSSTMTYATSSPPYLARSCPK
jgi:hypothetical protein